MSRTDYSEYMDTVNRFISSLSSANPTRSVTAQEFSSLAAHRSLIRICQQKIHALYCSSQDMRDAFSRLALLIFDNGCTTDPEPFWKLDMDQGRITWWHMLRYAEYLHISRVSRRRANQIIQTTYRHNAMAVNGYAAIALHERNSVRALPLFQRDEEANRLSPGFRLNYAVCLADCRQMTKAIRQVRKAYKADPQLKDGMARIAWQYYRKTGNTRKASRCFEDDFRTGRISPAWTAQYASLLAARDQLDRAISLVSKAYIEDPSLSDGYSSIAKRLLSQKDKEKALQLLEKDYSSGRQSPRWTVNYAIILGQHNTHDRCTRMIADAYGKDASITDAYSKLAWQLNLEGNTSTARALMDLDFSMERQTPAWTMKSAILAASTGDFGKAERLVTSAYARDTSLKDGYSQIAWQNRTRLTHAKVIALLKKDFFANRQSPEWSIRLAATMGGPVAKQTSLITKVYKSDKLIKDGYTAVAKPFLREMRLAEGARLIEKDIRLKRSSPETKQLHLDVLNTIARIDRIIDSHPYPLRRTLHAQWRAMCNLNSSRTVQRVKVLNSILSIPNKADAITQFYEIALCESYFFESPTKTPFILDCGTNIGMSLAYFKWLYPDARIVAFEPNPYLHDIAMTNIRRNRWNNVVLHNCALGDKDELVSLNIVRGHTMSASITGRHDNDATEHIQVALSRLQPYIDSTVDYLKMDIEGAERRVIASLRDMRSTIRQGFIEYHYTYGHADNRIATILRHLEANGYRVILKDAERPLTIGKRRTSASDADKWSNYIRFFSS